MFAKKVSDKERKQMAKQEKKQAALEKKGAGYGMKERVLTILKTLLIPALLAGVVCMVIYIAMENKAEEAQLKGQVVVMKSDVAANTYVAKEEYDKYFEQVSVELTAIPGTVFASVNDLPQNGFYIEEAMAKSQMVLSGDISTTDAVMDKYKGGYQVTSFNAMEFADGVNGSLRKGDIVDVYAVDPATEVLTLYAENVYVSEVYDSSGKKITEDSEVATSFTVYVTPEEVECVNMAVVNGGIQLYKKAD